MSVKNALDNLVNELKDSEEYKKYSEYLYEIKNNEIANKILTDYKKEFMTYKIIKLTGNEIPEDLKLRYEQAYEMAMYDETIHEFLVLEESIINLIRDIYDAIGNSIEIFTGYEEERNLN